MFDVLLMFFPRHHGRKNLTFSQLVLTVYIWLIYSKLSRLNLISLSAFCVEPSRIFSWRFPACGSFSLSKECFFKHSCNFTRLCHGKCPTFFFHISVGLGFLLGLARRTSSRKDIFQVMLPPPVPPCATEEQEWSKQCSPIWQKHSLGYVAFNDGTFQIVRNKKARVIFHCLSCALPPQPHTGWRRRKWRDLGFFGTCAAFMRRSQRGAPWGNNPDAELLGLVTQRGTCPAAPVQPSAKSTKIQAAILLRPAIFKNYNTFYCSTY